MKSGLALGLGILLGAGGAGVVAHFLLKQQYEQKADEEIAACREAFVEETSRIRKELAEMKKAAGEAKKEKAVQAMNVYRPGQDEPDNATQTLYSDPKKAEPAPKQETPDGWKRPYVIDPALFDAMDNPHKCLGLNYYPKDGVVTHSENDEPVSLDDLDRMVGREALTHFGEDGQESDRVCVRNDNWKVDYEICIQPKSWTDVLKEKPWLKK